MAQDPNAEDVKTTETVETTVEEPTTAVSSSTTDTETQDQKHKAVVAGATGSIGRHIVYLLVRDPRVSSVVALTRSQPRDPSFYGLDEKEDDISKLSHTTIDYSQDINTLTSTLGTDPNTFTIGFSGIGVYTGDVKNEEEFMDREYQPNIKIATASSNLGCKSWGYLSGNGSKIKESKGFFQPLFSWVKGSVERDLPKINNFNYVSTSRPSIILGRPQDKALPGFGGWLERMTSSREDKLREWKGFIHRDDIAKAMVHSVIDKVTNGNKPDSSKKDVDSIARQKLVVFENEDIRRVAKLYDELTLQLRPGDVGINTGNNDNDTVNDNGQSVEAAEEEKNGKSDGKDIDIPSGDTSGDLENGKPTDTTATTQDDNGNDNNDGDQSGTLENGKPVGDELKNGKPDGNNPDVDIDIGNQGGTLENGKPVGDTEDDGGNNDNDNDGDQGGTLENGKEVDQGLTNGKPDGDIDIPNNDDTGTGGTIENGKPVGTEDDDGGDDTGDGQGTLENGKPVDE